MVEDTGELSSQQFQKKKEKEKKRTRKKKHVETKTAVSFSLKSAFVNSKFIIVSLH